MGHVTCLRLVSAYVEILVLHGEHEWMTDSFSSVKMGANGIFPLEPIRLRLGLAFFISDGLQRL